MMVRSLTQVAAACQPHSLPSAAAAAAPAAVVAGAPAPAAGVAAAPAAVGGAAAPAAGGAAAAPAAAAHQYGGWRQNLLKSSVPQYCYHIQPNLELNLSSCKT